MTSGFYHYLRLVTKQTVYSRRMTRLSNQIFGEVVPPSTYRNLRPVRLLAAEPIDQQAYFVDYYPRHKETHSLMLKLRHYGLFRDEHEDFKEEMKRLRRLRGKGPPKKGEGKRAKKQT